MERKSRRVLTLMLAMMMVFGTVIGSINVSHADTVAGKSVKVKPISTEVEKDKEVLSDSAQKLVALGIVEGKGNGNIDPKANITRAEVTAIILRALGINSQNYAYKPSFADVAETAWYAKDMAVAKDYGLVFGVGNNKFAPENNVTNTELITILVRSLNYEKTTAETVAYPTFHITKAQQAGILKDVKADLAAVSTREDMFLLIDNALNSKVLESNAFGMYAPSELTMIEKHLGLKTYEVQIVDSGSLLGGLDKGKIKIEGPFGKDGKTETKIISVENTGLLNVDNLFGTVEVLMNKNNEIVYAKPVVAKALQVGVVKEVVRVNREDVVRFEKSNRDYKLSDKLVIVHNYEMTDTRNLKNLIEGLTIKYELVDNEITKIVIEDVKEVAIFKSLKNNILEMVSGSRINLKDMTEVTVYINGVESKLEDLKLNDLIYKFTKGKTIIIKASRDKVEGKLSTVGKLNNVIKIDNKEYDVSKTMKILVNAEDTAINATSRDLEELVGEKVTAYLNSNGEIELIVGDVDLRVESIFVIDKIERRSSDRRGYDYISLIGTNDKVKSYEVDQKANIRNLKEGDLVVANIYDNVITSIEHLTRNTKLKYHSVEELKAVVSKDINIRNLTIDEGRNVHYVKSANTPVFIAGTRNTKVINFDELNRFNDSADMTLVIKNKDVVAIYISNQDFKVEHNETRAVVLDLYVSNSSGNRATYMKVELDNEDVEDYIVDKNVDVNSFSEMGFGKKTTTLSDIKEGEIVRLVINRHGDIVEINEVPLIADLDVKDNIVKSVDRNGITIGNKDYKFSSRTIVVDARRNARVINPLDIPKNSLVVFSMNKNTIDNLIIIGNLGDNLENKLVYEEDFVKAVEALKSLVTKYKETKEVKLTELEALLTVAETKFTLVQSEKKVAASINEFKSLTEEIKSFKTSDTNNITTFKTLLNKFKVDLVDFKENTKTEITLEKLETSVEAVKVALAGIKDKTSLTKEIAELTTLSTEVETLKTANSTNVTAFKAALSQLEADLVDFKENEETKITLETLKASVETVKTALVKVNDKTSLTEEIAKLSTLTETIKGLEVSETPEIPEP